MDPCKAKDKVKPYQACLFIIFCIVFGVWEVLEKSAGEAVGWFLLIIAIMGVISLAIELSTEQHKNNNRLTGKRL